MINFVAYNPTRLHFGKGVVSELGTQAAQLGKHALLVYVSSSIGVLLVLFLIGEILFPH